MIPSFSATSYAFADYIDADNGAAACESINNEIAGFIENDSLAG